jgi:hypothetical protein
VAQDTQTNEVHLHSQIRTWFLRAETPFDFATLNGMLYSQLFLTPAEDPWLGVARPGTFTGLPGDGIARERR